MAKTQQIPVGELWQQLEERTHIALATGALKPIDTCEQIISDSGIPFLVHIAKNLQRKIRDKQFKDALRPDFNPFLAPEPALTVGAIGTKHLAVLNKFNVVSHHLLIVTREFEPQEMLLTQADFEALCWTLREVDGLGFYNGGTIAGASQRHKHMQLIPQQGVSGRKGFPIETVFPASLSPQPTQLDALPFTHQICTLPPQGLNAPNAAAKLCLRLYRQMLAQLRIPPITQNGTDYQSQAYNLLLTRRWMMVVPRNREHVDSISINAMGFAGSLFVRSEEELRFIEHARPLTLLQSVTGPGV